MSPCASKHDAEIVVGLGQIRLERQCPLVALRGVVQPALRLEDVAEIDVGVGGNRGLMLERPRELGGGFVVLALQQQNIAEVDLASTSLGSSASAR